MCYLAANTTLPMRLPWLGFPSLLETMMLKVKQAEQVFTCEFGLVVGQSFEAVCEWGEDSFHCAKHGAESQVE